MIDRVDAAADELVGEYINDYGVGVPASFGVVAGLAAVIAIPGLLNFSAETMYGKIGVLTLLTVAAVAALATRYTYREVDLTEYKLTREEDGPDT